MDDKTKKDHYSALLNGLMGAADSVVDTAQLVPDAYAGAKYYLGAGDGKAYQLPSFANSGVADKDSASYKVGNYMGTGAQLLIPVSGLASAGAKAARAADGAGLVGKAIKFVGGTSKAALSPSIGKAAMAAGAGGASALAAPAQTVAAGGQAADADPLTAGLTGAGTAYVLTPAKGGGKAVDLGEVKKPVSEVYGKAAGKAAEALKGAAARAGEGGISKAETVAGERVNNAKDALYSRFMPDGSPFSDIMKDALKTDAMNASKSTSGEAAAGATPRKNDNPFYSFDAAHTKTLDGIAVDIKSAQKEAQLNMQQSAVARKQGEAMRAQEFTARADAANKQILELQKQRDAINAAAKTVKEAGITSLNDEGAAYAAHFKDDPNLWQGTGFEREKVSPVEQAERIARNANLPSESGFPDQRGVWKNDADYQSLIKNLEPEHRRTIASIRGAAIGDSKSGTGTDRTPAEMHLQGQNDPYPQLKSQGAVAAIADMRNALGRDLDPVETIKLHHFIQTGFIPENGIAGVSRDKLLGIFSKQSGAGNAEAANLAAAAGTSAGAALGGAGGALIGQFLGRGVYNSVGGAIGRAVKGTAETPLSRAKTLIKNAAALTDEQGRQMPLNAKAMGREPRVIDGRGRAAAAAVIGAQTGSAINRRDVEGNTIVAPEQNENPQNEDLPGNSIEPPQQTMQAVASTKPVYYTGTKWGDNLAAALSSFAGGRDAYEAGRANWRALIEQGLSPDAASQIAENPEAVKETMQNLRDKIKTGLRPVSPAYIKQTQAENSLQSLLMDMDKQARAVYDVDDKGKARRTWGGRILQKTLSAIPVPLPEGLGIEEYRRAPMSLAQGLENYRLQYTNATAGAGGRSTDAARENVRAAHVAMNQGYPAFREWIKENLRDSKRRLAIAEANKYTRQSLFGGDMDEARNMIMSAGE